LKDLLPGVDRTPDVLKLLVVAAVATDMYAHDMSDGILLTTELGTRHRSMYLSDKTRCTYALSHLARLFS